MYSFPNLEPVVVPCLVLTVTSWSAYRFLRAQVRWSGTPISWRIFHSLFWSTQSKGFSLVNGAEVDVFLEFSCFFYDPTNAGNLISGSSAFLNLAWTSGSSQFTYCWSLAWRILSITLQVCGSLNILWHCLSLGLKWKLTFSSPVATAEFSKLAGILSAALWQHHLLEF